ncbi:hypothetical protein Lal_00002111 [Lupinus albus]|nr:hypothetical protein Lal_00002111 [Lupinus albus]
MKIFLILLKYQWEEQLLRLERKATTAVEAVKLLGILQYQDRRVILLREGQFLLMLYTGKRQGLGTESGTARPKHKYSNIGECRPPSTINIFFLVPVGAKVVLKQLSYHRLTLYVPYKGIREAKSSVSRKYENVVTKIVKLAQSVSVKSEQEALRASDGSAVVVAIEVFVAVEEIGVRDRQARRKNGIIPKEENLTGQDRTMRAALYAAFGVDAVKVSRGTAGRLKGKRVKVEVEQVQYQN